MYFPQMIASTAVSLLGQPWMVLHLFTLTEVRAVLLVLLTIAAAPCVLMLCDDEIDDEWLLAACTVAVPWVCWATGQPLRSLRRRWDPYFVEPADGLFAVGGVYHQRLGCVHRQQLQGKVAVRANAHRPWCSSMGTVLGTKVGSR